jgi:dephospho-CoA kinase
MPLGSNSINKTKLIICFTGMPGAGKSTAAEASQEIGFRVFNMGDCVREETIKRGLDLVDSNIGKVMIDIRKGGKMGAVADLILPKLRSAELKYLGIDGVRNMEEIEIIKKIGFVKILVIHASPRNRYNHQKGRGREDAPSSWELFKKRDERENDIGVGRLISLADEVISNNNISIMDLKKKTRLLLRKWIDSIEK